MFNDLIEEARLRNIISIDVNLSNNNRFLNTNKVNNTPRLIRFTNGLVKHIILRPTFINIAIKEIIES